MGLGGDAGGQGSPWLVLQSSRTRCRQVWGWRGPSSGRGPARHRPCRELGGDTFPLSPWSSASLGAAPRLLSACRSTLWAQCCEEDEGTSTRAMAWERRRGGLVLAANTELQQGELVSSFLPFCSPSLSLSSALCENPALFLTGEDPGRHCTSARTQGQKGAWGEPLSGARGGFCSTGTWDLLGPVKHCCCEWGSTGQVPQTPTAPVISDPFRLSLATCMGLGQLVTRAGFAPKSQHSPTGVKERNCPCPACASSLRTHLARWLIPDLQGLSDPVGFLNQIPASTCFPRQCPHLFGAGLPKNFKAK